MRVLDTDVTVAEDAAAIGLDAGNLPGFTARPGKLRGVRAALWAADRASEKRQRYQAASEENGGGTGTLRHLTVTH